MCFLPVSYIEPSNFFFFERRKDLSCYKHWVYMFSIFPTQTQLQFSLPIYTHFCVCTWRIYVGTDDKHLHISTCMYACMYVCMHVSLGFLLLTFEPYPFLPDFFFLLHFRRIPSYSLTTDVPYCLLALIKKTADCGSVLGRCPSIKVYRKFSTTSLSNQVCSKI